MSSLVRARRRDATRATRDDAHTRERIVFTARSIESVGVARTDDDDDDGIIITHARRRRERERADDDDARARERMSHRRVRKTVQWQNDRREDARRTPAIDRLSRRERRRRRRGRGERQRGVAGRGVRERDDGENDERGAAKRV